MAYDNLIFRVHAIRRMFQRGIAEWEVRDILEHGEVIEQNPDDLPYPSYITLGCAADRAVHVVASDDHTAKATIIVTAYEPDPSRWDKTFRRRTS
jgi:hypothetical protein